MGILGGLFGMDEDRANDFGARIALAGQALQAMSMGKQVDIADDIAYLNRQRRDAVEKAKSRKFYQTLGTKIAQSRPELGELLLDQNTPASFADTAIADYYKTLAPKPEDWATFNSGGDVYRYDRNDPSSKPSLFFDGPDDPFKQLLRSVAPPAPGSAADDGSAPSDATTPGASGSPSPMPGVTSSSTMLTPQQKQLAQMFGLPPDATVDDVLAVARAGTISEDQARSTAEAVRQRYKDARTQGVDLTKQQTENSFKLQDDYWRLGQKYQPILDAANEISTLPDDPNGFERVMTLYKYMRTLDPLGAVRESDAQMAQSASGPYSKLEQLFEQYGGVSGSEIPKDAALEMKRLIMQMGETTAKADYKARKKTLARAKAMGIPDDKAEGMIFGGLNNDVDMSGYTPRFEVPTNRMSGADERRQMGQGGATVSATTAQKGDVVDGYRFKGGDPANAANWEEVR